MNYRVATLLTKNYLLKKQQKIFECGPKRPKKRDKY